MRDGFIKVAAGTPKLRVADCAYNAEQIIQSMRDAAGQGVKVLCLPELCLTGYTCADLFLQSTLLKGAEEALETILSETGELDMVTALGMPVRRDNKLYNCAVLILRGEILGVIPKTYLPNYGEFYEGRWFTSGKDVEASVWLCRRWVEMSSNTLFPCETVPGLTIGVEICEDLWAAEPPSVKLCQAGATLILNLSASNEVVGKAEYRRRLITQQSARCLCGYVYADAGEGESTTDLVFAGHDLIAENGALLGECRYDRGLLISEIDVDKLAGERQRMNTFQTRPTAPLTQVWFSLEPSPTLLTRTVEPAPFVPRSDTERAGRCEDILNIAARGLGKRLEHTGVKTCVIGLSGGLDSTLALLITVRAFELLGKPHRDILCVTMPCFGTTARTRSNAELLAERLGCELKVVDITAAVNQHFADIGQDPASTDVTYENAQARERTQVLMDLANQTGGLVIGTGDLSELALGWCTYNGDHMSMYAVNSSIPKTLVRSLVSYEADRCKDEALAETLRDILSTPVSPELLPAENGEISQKTEDIVGPYELHDFYLYYAVRWAFPPRKVYRLAQYALGDRYDDATLLKWLKNFYRRFFSQQFKRSCMPDGPKVGTVALSPRGDWRMPSDAVAALWLEELEHL